MNLFITVYHFAFISVNLAIIDNTSNWKKNQIKYFAVEVKPDLDSICELKRQITLYSSSSVFSCGVGLGQNPKCLFEPAIFCSLTHVA